MSRYDPRPERSGFAPPPPLVRRVSLAGRDLIGDKTGPRLAQTLPPHPERLRIEFAPVSYAAGLTYQVRLEPVDRDWRPPRAEPFVECTNLGNGEPLRLLVLRLGKELGDQPSASATTGSMRAARWAGTTHAASATRPSRRVAAVRTAGSKVVTP